MLSHNAKVYIATQDHHKVADTIADLPYDVKKRAIFLPLDLSDLASVKAAAQEFLRQV